MRVLVCGDKEWESKVVIKGVLQKLSPSVLIHGGGIGAERIADEAARELGIDILCYPSQWSHYGDQAGVIKNQEIINRGRPRIVLAFFTFSSNIKKYREPADLIRKAKAAHLPILIFRGDVDEKSNPTRF